MNNFSELEDWLERKIEFHQKQGDEMLEIEKVSGSERYASAGQYQRVMAYRDVLANIRQPNKIECGFERLSGEVVLIDGKYYRQMTSVESAHFIWGNKQSAQQSK